MGQNLLSLEVEEVICRESPTVYLSYIRSLSEKDFDIHIERMVSSELQKGNIEEAVLLLALYSLRKM